jgi:membrane protein
VDVGKKRQRVMTVLGLLNETLNKWWEDRIPQVAAALAYYTVFSVAPLLLVAIGIAGLVLGRDEARAQILVQASSLLGAPGAVAVARLMGDAYSAPRQGMISAVIGIAAILIGAVAVLAQLKAALDEVWDVKPRPVSWVAFIRGYLINIAMVFATGFLLLVSLIVTATIGAATSRLRQSLEAPDLVWLSIDGGIGLVVTALIFGLIFKTLPATKVTWRDVRVGAIVTAVLFTLGRLALGFYLGRVSGDSAYTAAGSLLALLVWVYYSSQLILFGAEFTVVYARKYLPSHDAAAEDDDAALAPSTS